ncbi:MAG: uroporphyrinogen-III synthase [Gemmatimonadaceae bacterium]|nr:uroporphyrinogen-III synthase [Gemmatimonadaceae bacterium]
MMPSDAVEQVRPLAGTTIVVTRAADRAEQLVGPLEALGAEVLTYSATRIVPRDIEALRRAACELARYDWVIFTSATSVALLFDATEACGIEAGQWAHTRIAAVGSATAAAVRARGAAPTLVPEQFVAEALLQAFRDRGDLVGATMLFPAAAGARPELADGLRTLGARVDRIDAYESVATDEDVAGVRAAPARARAQRGDADGAECSGRPGGGDGPRHMRWPTSCSIGPITDAGGARGGLPRGARKRMPSTMEGCWWRPSCAPYRAAAGSSSTPSTNSSSTTSRPLKIGTRSLRPAHWRRRHTVQAELTRSEWRASSVTVHDRRRSAPGCGADGDRQQGAVHRGTGA